MKETKKIRQTAFSIRSETLILSTAPDVIPISLEFKTRKEDEELLRRLESKPVVPRTAAKMTDYQLKVLLKSDNDQNKEIADRELRKRTKNDMNEESIRLKRGTQIQLHCC